MQLLKLIIDSVKPITEYVKPITDYVTEYVKPFIHVGEKYIVNVLLTGFWYYNYFMARAEMFIGSKIGDTFGKKQFIEPDLPTWNCVCTMENNKLLEHYTYSEQGIECAGALCIRKEEKRRLCAFNGTNHIAGTPNNTRFLNVQYVHPDMKSPLKLAIDVSYIRNGNELFSKLFVLRMLNHQYNKNEYTFDDKYEVHLMDHSVNKVVIKSNQYLIFDDLANKCGYKVSDC